MYYKNSKIVSEDHLSARRSLDFNHYKLIYQCRQATQFETLMSISAPVYQEYANACKLVS